jgi:hypothetical protein
MTILVLQALYIWLLFQKHSFYINHERGTKGVVNTQPSNSWNFQEEGIFKNTAAVKNQRFEAFLLLASYWGGFQSICYITIRIEKSEISKSAYRGGYKGQHFLLSKQYQCPCFQCSTGIIMSTSPQKLPDCRDFKIFPLIDPRFKNLPLGT